MDHAHLAELLADGRDEEAAGLIASYTIPLTTSLEVDFEVHDLALVEVLAGSFTPAGPQVMIDVDAAFSFLGWARAGLLLYVGQPDPPGARLYDSGGKTLEGTQVHPVGSVNGETAWAETTHRRVVLDVDPSRPVTWQLVPAIVGASATVDAPGPRRITITPNGRKAFVTSPAAGIVTPVVLGRPGYSYDQNLAAMDVAQPAVAVGGRPIEVASDDDHVIVSSAGASEGHVTILSVDTHEVVHRITLPGGAPLGSALTPDGRHALVGTGAGHLARIDLASGALEAVELGDRITSVAVPADGSCAYAADADSPTLYRIGLPELAVEGEIALEHPPHVVRVAPDGQVWVLCRPSGQEVGRLLGIDPGANRVVSDHPLPFPEPTDLAIVPVEGQTFPTVRTAWIVYEGGRYSELYIGGEFTGEVHSFHHGSLSEGQDGASAVAVNDFGEIWVVQPDLDRVWKWPGGRFSCKADAGRVLNGAFFGEYCEVAVYGAIREPHVG